MTHYNELFHFQVKFVLMRVLSKETSAKNSPKVDGGEDVVSLSKKRRLIAICNDILEVMRQEKLHFVDEFVDYILRILEDCSSS